MSRIINPFSRDIARLPYREHLMKLKLVTSQESFNRRSAIKEDLGPYLVPSQTTSQPNYVQLHHLQRRYQTNPKST